MKYELAFDVTFKAVVRSKVTASSLAKAVKASLEVISSIDTLELTDEFPIRDTGITEFSISDTHPVLFEVNGELTEGN